VSDLIDRLRSMSVAVCGEAATHIEDLETNLAEAETENADLERRVNHMEDLNERLLGQLSDSQAATRDMERQRNEAEKRAVPRDRGGLVVIGCCDQCTPMVEFYVAGTLGATIHEGEKCPACHETPQVIDCAAEEAP